MAPYLIGLLVALLLFRGPIATAAPPPSASSSLFVLGDSTANCRDNSRYNALLWLNFSLPACPNRPLPDFIEPWPGLQDTAAPPPSYEEINRMSSSPTAGQAMKAMEYYLAEVESERAYHNKVLQSLEQLEKEMVSERQRIEGAPWPGLQDTAASPPYEEINGMSSSPTAGQAMKAMEYYLAEVESRRAYHKKVLQSLEQLEKEMVSERQRIEGAPWPGLQDTAAPPPSYEEINGMSSSPTAGQAMKAMEYYLAEVHGTTYEVGGNGIWSVPPAGEEDRYTDWASAHLFVVGDQLHFVYSLPYYLMTVSEAGYLMCDTSTRESVYTDGDSMVSLSIPGALYFIGSDRSQCLYGLRMHIIVHDLMISPPPQSASSYASPSSPPIITPFWPVRTIHFILLTLIAVIVVFYISVLIWKREMERRVRERRGGQRRHELELQL